MLLSGRHRRRQGIVLEALPQGRFLDLAGRGMGDFLDEDDIVGEPPGRDLALQVSRPWSFTAGLSQNRA
jgi:hypothetical protein